MGVGTLLQAAIEVFPFKSRSLVTLAQAIGAADTNSANQVSKMWRLSYYPCDTLVAWLTAIFQEQHVFPVGW